MTRNIITLTLLILIITSCRDSFMEPNLTTIQDKDGNLYQTVKIGDQYWMAENLNMSKFNNGNNNPFWIQSKAGKLYKSDALFSFAGGICPLGWHIPSKSDWDKLISFLGGDLKIIGGKLKKEGIFGWSNKGANTSGFNALPNGFGNKLFETTSTSFWGIDSLRTNITNSQYIQIFYTIMLDSTQNLTLNREFSGNGSAGVTLPYKLNMAAVTHTSCRCVRN